MLTVVYSFFFQLKLCLIISPTLCKIMIYFKEVQYVSMCEKYVLET